MKRRKKPARKRTRERPAPESVAEPGLGPTLAGGDLDADWPRAAGVGEEAPGGTDAAGEALGVPRAPDDEFRTSAEILEGRDRYRREEEE
jgi:hypothetical protein